MNMHVKAELKLEAGKSYRGKSGAIHRVETNDNSAWPFKTADEDLGVSRFWKIDGSGYNTDGWNSRAMIGEDLVELAPRFSVGDKVRRINFDNNPVMRVGTEWIVSGFKKYRGDDYLVFHGGSDGNVNNFELVSPATYTSCAAAEVDNPADEYGGGKKFKVEAGKSYIGDDGKTYGPLKDYDFAAGPFIIELGDGNVWDADGKYGKGNNIRVNLVAVAPATATTSSVSALRIQPGRYYKTRDGRKVGPMEARDACGSKYVWQYDYGRRIFLPDGTNFAGPNSPEDLIAEWQDEPAAAGFKVGDRVENVIPGNDYDMLGTVTALKGEAYRVRWDGHSSDEGLSWRPNELRLVASATIGNRPTTIADIVRKHSGKAVVMLIEDGQPKPSTLPFVHSSQSAAATEASRLAGINKGKEFGVYVCVDVKKVEKTYEHEWQRLAARGSKIPAIKAYRDAGGKRQTFVAAEWGFPARYEDHHVIGLKEAKDAVEHWLATAA
ncbi:MULTISPECIES: hypothetical protein [unclassified Mesorhizobium]|uniref:hypothetical protein n=1 Tax=unclassified Mesorhizobium TaxID=325217 RepID=UPI00112D5B15|nr:MULTISPECIES: hypothetical protein [unclassified Mesorhizobium]TPJ86925.1 hypothetical protein FJ489_30695 [Mesorhizobium sp. B2-5-12]TPK19148.1 hypothetical protein FJ562_31100 [Mesorhizobium sp. B2-5-6]